jgi:uridine kinase
VSARVIVIAGPSGSGKSQLCRRLGLPYVNLDDFYKDGDDPSLPLLGNGLVDWDHPGAWLHHDAVAAVAALCRDGEADVPVYDLSRDGRTGHRQLSLGGAAYFAAEGIFAQEIVRECADRGLLADALCIHNHRLVTFWRRLRRDLREHRKPPWVLLRRGLSLMRAEPDIVAHATALGCVPVTPHQAYARVRRLQEQPVSG